MVNMVWAGKCKGCGKWVAAARSVKLSGGMTEPIPKDKRFASPCLKCDFVNDFGSEDLQEGDLDILEAQP